MLLRISLFIFVPTGPAAAVNIYMKRPRSFSFRNPNIENVWFVRAISDIRVSWRFVWLRGFLFILGKSSAAAKHGESEESDDGFHFKIL